MNKEKATRLLKQFANKKGLFILGIIGIILIGISSIPFEKESKSNNSEGYYSVNAEEYRVALEKQVKEIVQSITGDKKAKILITLETGIIREYAGETEDSSSEKSDQNESSVSNDTRQKAITVKTSDGSEEALIITEYMPQVRGVAIVCNIGDNQQAKEKITQAVTAALGVTSKRVYIGGYVG